MLDGTLQCFFSNSTQHCIGGEGGLSLNLPCVSLFFATIVADRFGISATICSNTFTTWIKLISKTLGHALVVWLPREAIRDNLPAVFVKTGHSKCRVIIDCAEVFIERAKSLTNQAVTWSDYKHHNTLKFFIWLYYLFVRLLW